MLGIRSSIIFAAQYSVMTPQYIIVFGKHTAKDVQCGGLGPNYEVSRVQQPLCQFSSCVDLLVVTLLSICIFRELGSYYSMVVNIRWRYKTTCVLFRLDATPSLPPCLITSAPKLDYQWSINPVVTLDSRFDNNLGTFVAVFFAYSCC